MQLRCAMDELKGLISPEQDRLLRRPAQVMRPRLEAGSRLTKGWRLRPRPHRRLRQLRPRTVGGEVPEACDAEAFENRLRAISGGKGSTFPWPACFGKTCAAWP